MFTDLPTEFGFTGEQTDSLNDLVYLRARYMNPRLGIFGSLDPLEGQNNVVGSLNRYSWVRGNVVNRIDSSGMCAGHPYNLSDPNRDHECWDKAINLYVDYGAIIRTTMQTTDHYFGSEDIEGIRYGFDMMAWKLGGGTWSLGNDIYNTDTDMNLGQARFRGNLLPKNGLVIQFSGGDNGGGHVIPTEPNVINLNKGSGIAKTVIHEFNHVLAFTGMMPIWDFMNYVGSSCPEFDSQKDVATDFNDSRFSYQACGVNTYNLGESDSLGLYKYHPKGGPFEDAAEAFTTYMTLRSVLHIGTDENNQPKLLYNQQHIIEQMNNLRYQFFNHLDQTWHYQKPAFACREWVDAQARFYNDRNPDYSVCERENTSNPTTSANIAYSTHITNNTTHGCKTQKRYRV
jgi:RHS repeat-associated protein